MSDVSVKDYADLFCALTAIKLLKHKAERMLNRGQNVIIDEDDVNEILNVAGLPKLEKLTKEVKEG